MLGWLLSDDNLVVAFVIYKRATGYIGKCVIIGAGVLALLSEILA